MQANTTGPATVHNQAKREKRGRNTAAQCGRQKTLARAIPISKKVLIFIGSSIDCVLDV